MISDPSLPTGNASVATDVIACPDRRSTPRIDCHTVVTAVTPDAATNQMRVIKGNSEDVSIAGAKLMTREPLPSKRLFLRFLLPAFGNRYVEAEVVSEQIRERKVLKGRVTPVYVYGVRFTGVISDGQLIDAVLPAPAAGTVPAQADGRE